VCQGRESEPEVKALAAKTKKTTATKTIAILSNLLNNIQINTNSCFFLIINLSLA